MLFVSGAPFPEDTIQEEEESEGSSRKISAEKIVTITPATPCPEFDSPKSRASNNSKSSGKQSKTGRTTPNSGRNTPLDGRNTPGSGRSTPLNAYGSSKVR